MYQYDSIAHAISELQKRGYTADFTLQDTYIISGTQQYNPDEFEITEVIRFEGESDPGDEAIVYGIESNSGEKGILVSGYGYSAETIGEDMIRKLRMHIA